LPNIVVILADDMGYGDLGSYNPASLIPTPNIDALAGEGMRFTDAHSPSAVCTPTRYGLLTGRYAWRTRLSSGVLLGHSPALIEEGRVTLASLLEARGYATAAVGKWHLGLGSGERTDYEQPLRPGPNSVGFDYFFGIPASLDMPPYVYVRNEALVEPPTDSIESSGFRRSGGNGFWSGGRIAPGFRHIDVIPRLTDEAVDFIQRQQGSERPFFLYLPFSAPHTPWLPTAEFAGRTGAGPYGDFAAQKDHVTPAILREAGPAVRLDFGPVRDVAIQALKGRSEARFSDDAYGARRGGCVRPTREANDIEEIGGLDSVRARRFLRVNSLRAHR
jgi:arylsulfatase A-like enzyme